MSDIIITILSQYPTNFYFIMYKKKNDKQCTVVLSHTNIIYKTKHMHLSFLKKTFLIYERNVRNFFILSPVNFIGIP